jgi:hypothetical protein
MKGTGALWSNNTDTIEIDQIVSAQSQAREIARSQARAQLLGDSLHGATLSVVTREFGEGEFEIQSRLSGNRVRRFREFDALPVAQATVRLS